MSDSFGAPSLLHDPLPFGTTATTTTAATSRKPRKRSWEDNYALLLAFHAKHGHTQVPNRYKEDTQLGKWCSHNREYFCAGQLSQERIAALDAIGFIWSPHEKKWNDNFEKLEQFHKTNGHVKIRCNHPDDPGLGKWVKRQREDYQMGRINDERKKKLEALGFVWRLTKGHANKQTNTKNEEQWQKMFDELLQFKQTHGHTNVPRRDAEPNPLEKWVGSQRYKYAKKQLSKERIKKLAGVGFVWAYQKQKSQEDWNRMYNLLKQSQRLDGTFQPSTVAGGDASGLSRWIQRQKEKYKFNKLEVGRELLLRRLGFPFPERVSTKRGKGESDDENNDGDDQSDVNSEDQETLEKSIEEICNNRIKDTDTLLAMADGDSRLPRRNRNSTTSPGKLNNSNNNRVGQTVAESIRVLSTHMSITPEELALKLEGNNNNENGLLANSLPPHNAGNINAFSRLMPICIKLRQTVDESTLRDCVSFLSRMVKRANPSGDSPFHNNNNNNNSNQPTPASHDDCYNTLLTLAVDLDEQLGMDQSVVRNNAVIESCAIYFERFLVEAQGKRSAAVPVMMEAPAKRPRCDP